jgi:uncharacterized protein (TIGR02996 family)
MSESTAFLQAIFEKPDDDRPRLLYADWLDENGDTERAEFIRIQCALASLIGDQEEGAEFETNRAEIHELWQREQSLFEAHWLEWIRPLCLALKEPDPNPDPEWLNSNVRSPRFVHKEPSHTERDRNYELGPKRTTAPGRMTTVYRRFDDPKPRALSTLVFRRGFVDRIAIMEASGGSHSLIARLFELTPIRDLFWIGCRERSVNALIFSSHFAKLRELILYTNDVSFLPHFFWFHLLRNTLRIEIRDYPTESLSDYDSVPTYGQLRHLALRENALNLPQFRELMRSDSVQTLRSMYLSSWPHLGDKYARLLIQCPYLQNLHSLQIDQHQLSESARENLRSQFGDRLLFLSESGIRSVYITQYLEGLRRQFGLD